jgi:hypothetical protein
MCSAIPGDYFLATRDETPFALEDWRCPTAFRIRLLQTSRGIAWTMLVAPAAGVVLPAIGLGVKYTFSEEGIGGIKKNMYLRFEQERHYFDQLNDVDRLEPSTLRVDMRSPLTRFLEDPPITPYSIPESTDECESDSDMSSARTTSEYRGRSAQVGPSRTMTPLERRVKNMEERLENQNDRVRELDLLGREGVVPDGSALFCGAKLVLNDRASVADSDDLWRELEQR